MPNPIKQPLPSAATNTPESLSVEEGVLPGKLPIIKDIHCLRVTRLAGIERPTFWPKCYVKSHLLICENCRCFVQNAAALGRIMRKMRERGE